MSCKADFRLVLCDLASSNKSQISWTNACGIQATCDNLSVVKAVLIQDEPGDEEEETTEELLASSSISCNLSLSFSLSRASRWVITHAYVE